MGTVNDKTFSKDKYMELCAGGAKKWHVVYGRMLWETMRVCQKLSTDVGGTDNKYEYTVSKREPRFRSTVK